MPLPYSYGTIEKLNTELQQMSEDLKEIIRVTNVSNKLSDRTDPVRLFDWKVCPFFLKEEC